MNRSLMKWTVLLAIAVVSGVSTQAVAALTLVKSLDFNVDGVYPSSEPDIDFNTNTTPPVTESDVYTVQNGRLEQRTLDSHMGSPGYAGYDSPDINLHGNQFSADQGIVMEARLRILDIEAAPTNDGGESLGAYFGAHDGAYTYQVLFDETGVFMRGEGPLASRHVDLVDLETSGFHTYRMTTPANSNQYDLFIDGQHVLTALAYNLDNYNGYGWGDGRSAPQNGGSVDWDYVRVWKGEVPEPSGVLLSILALGIAVTVVRPVRSV